MEKSIITTGKTIDAAVETALAQLGLTRDDVTYQVITLPKSGFLGIGAVPAKVQVTYEAPDLKPAVKAEEKKPEAPKAEEKKAEAPKTEAAPRIALSSASRSKPKAPKAETPKVEQKPAEKKPVEKKPEAPKAQPAPKAPKAEKKPVEKKAPEKKPVEKKPEAPKTARTYEPAQPGSNEEKIEVFLKGLLENMDSKAVPHCWSDAEGSYRVELTGEGLGFLVGIVSQFYFLATHLFHI